MKKNSPLYLLLSLIMLSACTSVSSFKEEYDYNLIRGINYFQKNQKDEALKSFLAAHKNNPHDVKVLRELAYFYASSGRMEEAKKYYIESIKNDGEIKDNITLENLVKIYLSENNYLEAERYLDLITDRNSLFYLKNKILILSINKNNDKMKIYLDKLISLKSFYQVEHEEYIIKIIASSYPPSKLEEIFTKLYPFNKNKLSFILSYADMLSKRNVNTAIVILKDFISYTESETERKQALIRLASIYASESMISEYKNTLSLIER